VIENILLHILYNYINKIPSTNSLDMPVIHLSCPLITTKNTKILK
jgi:hypothetical protein